MGALGGFRFFFKPKEEGEGIQNNHLLMKVRVALVMENFLFRIERGVLSVKFAH